MNTPDVILSGLGSISALGTSQAEVWESYDQNLSKIIPIEVGGALVAAAPLGDRGNAVITSLIEEQPRFGSLDRSVLLAIVAARQAFDSAGWQHASDEVAVNIGSSRGATGLFEQYHQQFLESSKRRVGPLASPTTTLGNISSWVLQDLRQTGFAMSHSITCSTALQAIGNAIAWIRAGMATRVLAGGAEAPLTPFSIAQMQALKVYAKRTTELPCRPCSVNREEGTGMVLGEGAAVLAIEAGVPKKGDIIVSGFGSASEDILTPTSISAEGNAFFKAMSRAIEQAGEGPDAIVVHAPGTEAGDSAELAAIARLFPTVPILLSNKWLVGHTFGASGALSVEYARYLLERDSFGEYPYPTKFENQPKSIRRILINAAGFGGNAASVFLRRA